MGRSNWMEECWESIKNREIWNVILPGTHNSGTFNDDNTTGCRCQDINIGDQLQGGIRYLDIRVMKWNDQYVMHHEGHHVTNGTQDLQPALEQMAQFAINNPYEIFIVHLDSGYKSNLTDNDKTAVKLMFYNYLSYRLVPYYNYLSSQSVPLKAESIYTLAKIKESNKNIILLSSIGGLDTAKELFWCNSLDFFDTWEECQTSDINYPTPKAKMAWLKPHIEQALKSPKTFRFLCASCMIWTINLRYAAEFITNNTVSDWIIEWANDPLNKMNIFLFDFFEICNNKVVDTIITLNKLRGDDKSNHFFTDSGAQKPYYSTIQSTVVDNELFLLARTAKGIDTWKLDTISNVWSRITTDSPLWADRSGWDQEPYYSTIQSAVVNDQLFLMARSAIGIETWKFDTTTNVWSNVTTACPPWSDGSGWGQAAYYSSIHSAVVDNQLFLLARSAAGIHIWKFDTVSNVWSNATTVCLPLSDASGWGKIAYYSTIQSVVVDKNLFLLARSAAGIHIWKFDTESNVWSNATTALLPLSDTNGWSQIAYYSTIQSVVVDKNLFLLARSTAGIHTWKYDTISNVWSNVSNANPHWSDDSGWGQVAYYSTIQSTVVNKDLFLLARSAAGIETWKLDTVNNVWSNVTTACPPWSDGSGWNLAAYYSTIQSVVVNNQLFLLARSAAGISAYLFDSTKNSWSVIGK